MYVLDGVLFSFEFFAENFNEEDKIYQILSQIDCSSIEEHFRYKGYGRKGSVKPAIFRALVLKRLIGITTTKSLVTCLSYSPQLAYWCGFKVSKRIPSESTFSRFETKMTSLQLQEALNSICEKLSSELLALTGSSDQVIIDSTDIPAHEKPSRASTTGASFGHRTASTGEDEMFYGYKLHLAVVNTTAGPVPVAARVAPAYCSDMDNEITSNLMKEAYSFHRHVLGNDPRYYLMDAGYDAGFIYSQALDQGGQAIIKLNHRGHKNTSKDFTDDGTPYCPAGFPMSYYGIDHKKLINKFRCPRRCGQEDVTCQYECGCESSYGYIKRISIKENPRMFCSPHRGSRTWNELYSKRSSIERIFSVLKGHLNMDRLTKRGIEKAFTDVLICLITFLAGTIVQIRKQEIQKAA
ncbi:MAG: Transposase DDE domain protein [Pelotomaculum sp. PtaB.Bin013]|nr:MAG: Transposase DDE domain protein [Pelotomaculum sp. PtaB.Bin013]